MKLSLVKKRWRAFLKNKKPNQEGFTLIEILVALFLVVVILGLALNRSFSTREDLSRTLDELETALRYARDEAALRNSIVRLNIKLEMPQKYSLEYGPNDNFVLPPDLFESQEMVTSNEEDDYMAEQQKEIEKKFHKIKAFENAEKELTQGVKFIGGATTFSQSLITEGRFAVYVYPTGEMDAGILLLSSEEEVGALSFQSFTNDYQKEYRKFRIQGSTGNTIDQQFDTAEEFYEEWRSDAGF